MGADEMSLDFYIYRSGKYDDNGEVFTCNLFQSNITHNLGKMAEAAGIYGALWRPEENGFVYARDVITVLADGLAELRANPTKYEAFNSENGWGLYKHFVPFVQEILTECINYPNARIRACR